MWVVVIAAVLMVALLSTAGLAATKEVYKSVHFGCYKNAGYYYGTACVGIRVNYDSTSKTINWITVTATPYYAIYPTSNKVKTSMTITGLVFRKADGSYYTDASEWEANGTKNSNIYTINEQYNTPEVTVTFKVNETVPQSQHRSIWSTQYGFGAGTMYLNNNEQGYSANKATECPYCAKGVGAPGLNPAALFYSIP